ncbi:hypothetical protein ILUMI_04140 [Ignelater luminosus]|uniref:RETREG1-3/ARL6IP-like N-terminal reticulon-homology domain-containing protein n=1 Tax=Ignelater luminosus TaxID=2038154 RepID=A0A8K0GJU7_IGNLU|nr:hypothetical protein ILUMI_04140 [Ignelater luminosus]
MEFLSRTFRDLVHRFSPVGRNSSLVDASRMNAYLNAFYKVLVGDNPKLNFMALAVLSVLLRLIQTLEMRFYGALCTICMVVVLCDYFFERRDLKAERNATTNDALQQIKELVANIICYLCSLRRNNPSGFCTALCGIFLFVIIIANNLSGYAIMYLALIIIFTTPLIFNKIPSEYITNVRQIVTNTMPSNEGVLAESELLPFIENKDFNEQEADLESLLTDKTADSVTNSLISGITSMPSHLDAEGGSLDGLEEEDLEFAIRSTQASGISVTPGDLSSDSDSDHKKVTRDLTDNSRLQESDLDSTSKATQVLEKGTQNTGILGSLSVIGSNLISNVIKSAVSNRTPKRHDSDSDFEIIDSDEVDDDVAN